MFKVQAGCWSELWWQIHIPFLRCFALCVGNVVFRPLSDAGVFSKRGETFSEIPACPVTFDFLLLIQILQNFDTF